MIRSSVLLRLSASSLAVLISAAPVAVQAQQRTYSLDIPAQDMGTALKAIAAATGQQVVFKGSSMRGKRSNAVRGSHSIDDAISAAIRGQGLASSRTSRGIIVVSPASSQPALSGTSPPAHSLGEAGAGSAAAELESAESSQIVVTGTRIRGAPPASPVRIVNRTEIERSGFATTGDVIRSLPQAYSGNINPGVIGGVTLAANLSAASSADLRGLGPGATLTLLNGHRIAYNGYVNTVDISIIPLPAVERVDILTDGASALYGSDAVAGVVNFILRDDFEGIESTVRAGTSTGGGASEIQLSQLAGARWSTGNIMANFEYLSQEELRASQREISRETIDPTFLIPKQKRGTLFLAGNQQLTSSISLFMEGFYTFKDVDNEQAFNFFGLKYKSDSHTDTSQYGVTGGLKISLPKGWQGELAITKSENKEQFSNTATGDVQLAFDYEFINTLFAAEANTSGPVISLPAGDISAALGAGYRKEKLDNQFDSPFRTGGTRDVRYAFGELRVPLVKTEQHDLQLSAAGRYEDYSDFGSVFNPKVGIVYRNISGIRFRGTWGESFRAPGLFQVYGNRAAFFYPAALFDIPGATADQTGLLIAGANQELRPERSRSWTLGADFSPPAAPGLTLSATYYNIDYRGRIGVGPNSTIGIYDNPDFQTFIIKDPSPDIVAAYVAAANDVGNFADQPIDFASVKAIFLANERNARSQKIRGIDLRAVYGFPLAGGTADLSADASWLDIRQRDTDTSPQRKVSGFVFAPREWKARGGATWQKNGFSLSAAVNYVGGGIDNSGRAVFGATNTDTPIGSWTTFDLQFSYDTAAQPGAGPGTRFSLSASNLFDQDPPRLSLTSTGLDFAGIGFDSQNASALGRFISLTVTRRW